MRRRFAAVSTLTLLVIALALAAAWPLSSPSGAQEPPPGKAEDWRPFLRDLTDQVVARLDEIEAIRSEVDARASEATRAQMEFENLDMNQKVAEIGINEYKKGIYPQDLEGAEGEISAAKAGLDRAREKLRITEQALAKYPDHPSYLRLQIDDETAIRYYEASIRVAERKKQTLEEFTKPVQTATREADFNAAKSKALASQANWLLSQQAEAKARRKLERDGLNPDESRAMAELDEAVRLDEQGDAEAAGAKVAEAIKSWDRGKAARTKALYARKFDRIRGALSKPEAQ